MKNKTADMDAWMPCIRRSLFAYYQLPAATRAEIFAMARRGGYSRRPPSKEAMAWWGRLPGLPRHNRWVFEVIKNAGRP